MEHRHQPQDSPNSQHLPSVLLCSWALVLLEWVRQPERFKKKKKVFSCWHSCQAATEFESGWSLSQYYRGISIRESKLYAILTTKTSESMTNLPKLHNALSIETSPPLHLHRYLSANSQVSQPGASAEAQPLHIQPAQLRFWASCSHKDQVLSQVWLCRHSTVGAVQWGR